MSFYRFALLFEIIFIIIYNQSQSKELVGGRSIKYDNKIELKIIDSTEII